MQKEEDSKIYQDTLGCTGQALWVQDQGDCWLSLPDNCNDNASEAT